MFKKLIVKQANPYCGWIKFGVLLLFPSFIYSHEIWAVAVFLLIQIIVSFSFPKPKESQKIDFMYHMVRGVYLEFVGEAIHYSVFWQRMLGKKSYKIMTLSLYVMYFVFSSFLLWHDYLQLGSLFYYAGISLLLSALTDYADISKNHPMSESWTQALEG